MHGAKCTDDEVRSYHFVIAVWRAKRQNPVHEPPEIEHCNSSHAVCYGIPHFADDFKTTSGKEYKNATVTQVEADGIVIKTKGGISKVYFTELPKDVQERFHYDPAQAAAAQAAAVRQTQELNQFNSQQEELAKQQKAASAKQYQQGLEQQAKYNNVQALTDQLSILQQQEQNLLVRIGQAEKRKEEAWRRWVDGRGGQYRHLSRRGATRSSR